MSSDRTAPYSRNDRRRLEFSRARVLDATKPEPAGSSAAASSSINDSRICEASARHRILFQWCVPPLKSALKIGWFPVRRMVGDGMNPFVWSAAQVLLVAAGGLVIATAKQSGPDFIVGHKTVTEDHGCQKLTSLNTTKSCMSFSPAICI